jgi:hypothetical protein
LLSYPPHRVLQDLNSSLKFCGVSYPAAVSSPTGSHTPAYQVCRASYPSISSSAVSHTPTYKILQSHIMFCRVSHSAESSSAGSHTLPYQALQGLKIYCFTLSGVSYPLVRILCGFISYWIKFCWVSFPAESSSAGSHTPSFQVLLGLIPSRIKGSYTPQYQVCKIHTPPDQVLRGLIPRHIKFYGA